jgi:hypothetical protein
MADIERLWWRRADSNRHPPACKAGALPVRATPPNGVPSLMILALCPRFTAREARRPRYSERDRISTLF